MTLGVPGTMAPKRSPAKYEQLQQDEPELADPEAAARAFPLCPHGAADWPEFGAGRFSRLCFQWFHPMVTL